MRCVHCKGKKVTSPSSFVFFFSFSLSWSQNSPLLKLVFICRFKQFGLECWRCSVRIILQIAAFSMNQITDPLVWMVSHCSPPPSPQGTVPQGSRVGFWLYPSRDSNISNVKGIVDRFFCFFFSSLLDLRQRSRRCGRLRCLMWMCLSVNTEEWLWLQTDVCELIRPH